MVAKKATSASTRGVPAKKTAPTKAVAAKTAPTKAVAAKTAVKVPAKTTAKAAETVKTTTKVQSAGSGPQRLRVRENERPWTVKELAAVRAGIEADLARLQKEIALAELDLAGLMRDAGDGAGDDQADAGTATFEREQEISLANNAREMFEQSGRALARIVDGSYGVCESCGSPIGKNRLLAFPRATLCLTCKSKQERR
jgi:RNA polymerase-binding transcription factor DksA